MRSSVILALASLALGGVAAGCANSPTAPEVPRAALGPAPIGPPPPPPPIATYTRYMAFGDSMTDGSSADIVSLYDPGITTGYPFTLQALLAERYTSQTMQVQNDGCGGRAAGASLDDLVTNLARNHPEVTILLDGVNDLNGGATPSDTVDEMGALSNTILQSGSQLMLVTLPPQRVGGQRALAPQKVVPYNQLLTQLAQRLHVPIVDIYPLITTPLADGLLSADGLHPTDRGNQRIAQAISEEITLLWERPGVSAPDRHRTAQDIPPCPG